MRPSTKAAVWDWSVFTHITSGAQTNQTVLTPTSGHRLLIHRVETSNTTNGSTMRITEGNYSTSTCLSYPHFTTEVRTHALTYPFEAPKLLAEDAILKLTQSGGGSITVITYVEVPA